jgi:3-isopropylmalate/(R)-2-methylmalate dehydratase small subunit
VDLPEQRVTAAGIEADFAFDPHTKHLLVEGLDQIALTLTRGAEISAFEATRPSFMPVTTG